MAQPGDLVQSKWEIDVRDDGKYYDKRHRITLKKKRHLLGQVERWAIAKKIPDDLNRDRNHQ